MQHLPFQSLPGGQQWDMEGPASTQVQGESLKMVRPPHRGIQGYLHHLVPWGSHLTGAINTGLETPQSCLLNDTFISVGFDFYHGQA